MLAGLSQGCGLAIYKGHAEQTLDVIVLNKVVDGLAKTSRKALQSPQIG